MARKLFGSLDDLQSTAVFMQGTSFCLSDKTKKKKAV